MIKLTVILGLVFFINSCSGQKLSPDKLKDDIDFLVKTYESVHPNLYAYYSKDSFYCDIDKVKAEIVSPKTALEFWLLLSPLVNKLGFGHSLIPYSDNFNDNQTKKRVDSYIPITIYIIDTTIFLDDIYVNNSDLIPRGSVITKINGIDAKEIIDSLIDYFPGELIDYRRYSIQSYFSRYYSLLFPSKHFKIEYVENDHKKIAKVKGIKKEVTNKPRIRENYNYSINGKTCLLEYNSCTNKDEFEELIENMFIQIEKDKVENLIVDIRKNQGGNSILNVVLFSRLYNKPFKSLKRNDVKISPEIIKRVPSYKRYGVDTIITRHRDFNQPKENIFNGNIYVLTSTRTFSSGRLCALLFKDYGVGKLIGQETGSPASAYGDIYKFNLPYSNLRVYSCFKYFLRPSGIDDGRGVIPDIEINYSIDDYISGKDLEMEYVTNDIQSTTNHNILYK
ncbi:S41 family peptidase [Saccharicrinis sp. FJH2]|uniref:S41 family peptidase n=1 Tax=Saccharicrinis sp. FJH65 TaxID=3344659 RepID=UPI0035F4130A